MPQGYIVARRAISYRRKYRPLRKERVSLETKSLLSADKRDFVHVKKLQKRCLQKVMK